MYKIKSSTLAKADRASLERLATYIHLSFKQDWSTRHLAALVYWRITRPIITKTKTA